MKARKPAQANPAQKPAEDFDGAPLRQSAPQGERLVSGSGIAMAASLSAAGVALAGQSDTPDSESSLTSGGLRPEVAAADSGEPVVELAALQPDATIAPAAAAPATEAAAMVQDPLTVPAPEVESAAPDMTGHFAPPLGNLTGTEQPASPIPFAAGTVTPQAAPQPVSHFAPSTGGGQLAPDPQPAVAPVAPEVDPATNPIAAVTETLIDPLLGEGGVVDSVLDPLLGEGGLVPGIIGGVTDGVIDPLLGEGGVVDTVLDPLLGEGGLVTGVIGGVTDGVLNPLLGQGGVVDTVLDPLLGEGGLVTIIVAPVLGENGILGNVLAHLTGSDGAVGAVLNPLLSQDGLLSGALAPVLGTAGAVTGVVDMVSDGLLDPILGEDGLVGTVLDPVLGEGGVLETVTAPLFGEDSPISQVLEPIVGETGVLGTVVTPILGADGLLGTITAPLVGENGLLGPVLEPIIGNGGVLDTVLSPIFSALGPIGGLLGSITGGLLGGQSWAAPAPPPVPDAAADLSHAAPAEAAQPAADIEAPTTDLLHDAGSQDTPLEHVIDHVIAPEGDDGFLDGLLSPALLETGPLETADDLVAALGGGVLDPVMSMLLSDTDLPDIADLGPVEADPLGDLLGLDLTGTLVDQLDPGEVSLLTAGEDAEVDSLLQSIIDNGEGMFGGGLDPLTTLLDVGEDLGEAAFSDLFGVAGAVENALSALFGTDHAAEADLLATSDHGADASVSHPFDDES